MQAPGKVLGNRVRIEEARSISYKPWAGWVVDYGIHAHLFTVGARAERMTCPTCCARMIPLNGDYICPRCVLDEGERQHKRRRKRKKAKLKDYGHLPTGAERHSNYPPEWTHELKSRIRKRDGKRCHICGDKKRGKANLHVHHIDGNKHNCAEENLITLCWKCHGATHRTQQAADWYAYVLPLKRKPSVEPKF